MPQDDGVRRRDPGAGEVRERIARRPVTGSSFSNGVYDGWENLSLYDRCITRGYPSSLLPAIYGDSYQIIQGPGYVAIRYEMVNETRIIPLDGRPALPDGITRWLGSSRGHWDGKALVIETGNFNEQVSFHGSDTRLKVTERLTLDDPDTVVGYGVLVLDKDTDEVLCYDAIAAFVTNS